MGEEVIIAAFSPQYNNSGPKVHTGYIVYHIYQTGTLGLMLASKLLGADSIISYGDWVTPGQIRIKAEESDIFLELVKDEEAHFTLVRNAS